MTHRLLAAFLALASWSPLRATDPPSKPWPVVFQPDDVAYPSWNWSNHYHNVSIESAVISPFPDSVKKWELAVCAADNPAKNARVQLPNPHQGQWIDLSTWNPGSAAAATLDSLGEGTFFCAILGDGKRLSNVSRVTIDHRASRTPTPGMRLIGITSPQGNIRSVLLFVSPTPGQKIWEMDVAVPLLCIDGKWHVPMGIVWDGPNGMIRPGDVSIGNVAWDNYGPSIAPFKSAHMQLLVVSDISAEFRSQLWPPRDPDPVAYAKRILARGKGYLSPVVTIAAHPEDEAKFSSAFGPAGR